jgi:hypothetical protein
MSPMYVICAYGHDGESILVEEIGYFTDRELADKELEIAKQKQRRKYNPDSLFVEVIEPEAAQQAAWLPRV